MNTYEIQKHTENQCNRKQRMSLIIEDILSLKFLLDSYENFELTDKHLYLLANLADLQTTNLTTLLSMCSLNINDQEEYVKCMLDLIKMELIVVELKNNYCLLHTRINLDLETKNKLNNLMYLPPMIVRPKKVTRNSDSGYLTIDNDSLLLNKTHHNKDICLDHINRMNKICLKLDLDSLLYITDKQEGLSTRLPEETIKQYVQRVENFEQLQVQTKTVIEYIKANDNSFYLTHKYDYRGRVYSQGYTVNYQGNDYRKAMIELSKEEVINENGLLNLKNDIANNFGLDKKTYQEKLKFISENSYSNLQNLVSEAEEPSQFLAGLQAYKKYLTKQPTGYLATVDATASGYQLIAVLTKCMKTASICNLIPDGTRQDNYTILFNRLKSRCKKADIPLNDIDRAKNKKCLIAYAYGSSASPKNLYGEDTPQLNAFYNELRESCPGVSFVNENLLSLWNSKMTEYSFTLPDLFTVQKTVVKEGKRDMYIPVLDQIIELPYRMNQPINYSRELPANVTHSVDSYIVREMCRRCNFDPRRVNKVITLINKNLSKLKHQTCVNHFKLTEFNSMFSKTGIVSVRVIDYINKKSIHLLDKFLAIKLKEILLDMLRNNPFELITIHDAFKAHPNNINVISYWYQELLLELLDGSLLEHIIGCLVGKQIAKIQLSNPAEILNLKKILENKQAIYAVC